MKKIPLTQGKYALVDDADYELLSQYKWHITKLGYPMRNNYQGVVDGKPKNNPIYMHREIMDTPAGMVTDHIDGDKLDNRRKNLQICTQGLNVAKRANQSNNTSGYRGVTYNKRREKWVVRFTFAGKEWFLGYHEDKATAAKAYDKQAKSVLGDMAVLNFKESI